MRCTCDDKYLMNDSWLSGITVKLLTGSRGHSGVVSDDGKISQRAESAFKEERFTDTSMCHPQMNASHCVVPEGKKRLGSVSSAQHR